MGKELDLSKYKVMIAIPCMRSIPTEFFGAIINLNNNGNTVLAIEANSLVYWARNQLTIKAMKDFKCDYILWLDSDMTFEPDLLIKLLTDAVENDLDFVTGLCFTRVMPTKPTICKKILWGQDSEGNTQGGAETYVDYPKDQLFEIAGAGLACALVKVSAIDDVGIKCKMSPFQPLPQLSEDYSFCFRLQQLGYKMWCDSRVKVGHVGSMIYNENVWLEQEKKNEASR